MNPNACLREEESSDLREGVRYGRVFGKKKREMGSFFL